MRPLAILCIAGILPVAAAPCATVDRDQILASDIALQLPFFAELDPHLVAGLAPVPGSRRTLSGHELNSIAEKAGVTHEGITPGLCFERKVAPLNSDDVKAAMLATLQIGGVSIQVVDFSRLPVPSGELSFPRSGLTIPAAAQPAEPVLWRGSVRYSAQHTIAIWARVRIEQRLPMVVAIRDLRAKTVIAPGDVVVARRAIFPFEAHVETLDAVAGRVPRKTIPAGSIITEGLIEIPPDIEPGETVHVIATRGSARITFDATARTGGRKGDSIVLLNPESHRSFHAIVEGKGRAHAGGEG